MKVDVIGAENVLFASSIPKNVQAGALKGLSMKLCNCTPVPCTLAVMHIGTV